MSGLTDSRRVFYLKTDSSHQGPRHRVEIDGQLVRRYSLVPDSERAMDIEGEIASLAWEYGVDTLGMECEFNGVSPYHTMELARGTCLAELPRDGRRAIYVSLAAQLLKLHSVEASGAGLIVSTNPLKGVYSHWGDYLLTNLFAHLRYCRTFELLAEKQAENTLIAVHEFTSTLDSSVPIRLLHGDLNDKNLFAENGEISAIIDWEDALAGDPLFDLAFWATFRPEEEWPLLLDAYYGARASWGVSSAWKRAFWTYYLRIALCKLVLLHKEGYRELSRAQGRVALGLERLAALS